MNVPLRCEGCGQWVPSLTVVMGSAGIRALCDRCVWTGGRAPKKETP